MLIFDPVRHQYKNEHTGEPYISVSQLLGNYKKPFNSKVVAERVAAKEGTTTEAVLEKWKKINVDSQVYGTAVHKAIEDYHTLGTIDKEYEDIILSYIELNILSKNDELLSEHRLYSHTNKLAGTADIIRLEKKGGFSIFDIKTNKKFNLFSQYNDQLLYPLDHLPSCEFTTYSLQLSLYAYMYQEITGRLVNQLGIFHYDREQSKFIYYPIMYMKNDVIQILKHYGESKLG